MPKARRDHRCTLCFDPIPKGTEYHFQRITPWDHPDNETFFNVKAHDECWDYWRRGIGEGWDWCFPDNGHEFKEAVRELKGINPPVPALHHTFAWAIPRDLRMKD